MKEIWTVKVAGDSTTHVAASEKVAEQIFYHNGSFAAGERRRHKVYESYEDWMKDNDPEEFHRRQIAEQAKARLSPEEKKALGIE